MIGGETKIKQCNCDHEFQDELYGKKMRVHTYGERSDKRSGSSMPGLTCTVCGKVTGV